MQRDLLHNHFSRPGGKRRHDINTQLWLAVLSKRCGHLAVFAFMCTLSLLLQLVAVTDIVLGSSYSGEEIEIA